MLYIGADIHKKTTTMAVKNAQGDVLLHKKLPNDKIVLRQFVKSIDDEKKLTAEATFNWYWFIDLMEKYVDEVILAHPQKAKILMGVVNKNAKTDKLDAMGLAELLRLDMVPKVFIPPKEIRDVRELLRYRLSLVRIRTSVKNRVHGILHKNGVNSPFSDLFGKSGRVYITSLSLHPCYTHILTGYLALVEFLDELISNVEKEIHKKPLVKNKDIQLLLALPGVGELSAFVIKYETIDIGRFASDKKYVSYCGLAPSTSDSADVKRHGGLIPQANRYLKWVFIESAHHARWHWWFKPTYQRALEKHGKNIAKIAVARELARITYFMLSRGEPFRGSKSKKAPPKQVSPRGHDPKRS